MLNTDEQIKKLEAAENLADDASKSADVVRRFGAFLLHAGFVDFIAIQSARLVEQIILKRQLAEGRKPTFQPREDAYFYDRHVSTRTILKGIRRLLPFKSPASNGVEEAKRVTDLADRMIDLGFKFLDHRNLIVHHIGDPRKRLEDVVTLCDEANELYHRFRAVHTAFFEAAGPYRFSQKEVQYFYGK